METNLTKYKTDLESLITRGRDLHDGLIYELRNEMGDAYRKLPKERKEKISKCIFTSRYNEWYNESLVLIKQLMPERLTDFQSYYRMDKRKSISHSTYTVSDYLIGIEITLPGSYTTSRLSVLDKFKQQFYIVKSLKSRFESSLYDIKQLLQADVFDSEIDSARELCKKGFYRAAGAICGVVIEKHLSEVCVHHDIKVTKKNPVINDYNEALKANNVVDVATWRNIQRLADIRNMCDHHKDVEPTKDNIEELIAGTDKMLKTIF